MQLYQYEIATWEGNFLYSEKMQADLNLYGLSGWELVTVVEKPWGDMWQATAYFKRPIIINE